MEALFTPGRMVDFIMALVLAEAVVLSVIRLRTSRGPRVADILWNLAAGFFLLVALRAALADASWPWVAVSLAAAGLAHGMDQTRRWRA